MYNYNANVCISKYNNRHVYTVQLDTHVHCTMCILFTIL